MVQPFRNSSPVLTVGQPLSSVCPLLVKQGADFILYILLYTFKQLHVSSVPLDPGVTQSCSQRVPAADQIQYCSIITKITEKLFVLTKDRLYLHSATPPFVHKKETGGAGGDRGNETKDVL